jgi:hypothetical protein
MSINSKALVSFLKSNSPALVLYRNTEHISGCIHEDTEPSTIPVHEDNTGPAYEITEHRTSPIHDVSHPSCGPIDTKHITGAKVVISVPNQKRQLHSDTASKDYRRTEDGADSSYSDDDIPFSLFGTKSEFHLKGNSFYSLADKHVFCHMWDKTQGKLGSCETATCLLKHNVCASYNRHKQNILIQAADRIESSLLLHPTCTQYQKYHT